MEHFFKEFDNNGWSVWEIKYNKAEGEGEILYKTCNLMKGFTVRMDRMRKDSFGVLGIYGAEPDLNISGVLFWRGLDIYPDL
jgi:elongation factor 1-gamma